MKLLDARGLSCPEPVILIRRALAGEGGTSVRCWWTTRLPGKTTPATPSTRAIRCR